MPAPDGRPDEVIAFDHVSRVFVDGARTIEAVRDASFSAGKGELLAIRGKSGSGKSTLLNLTCGIDHPTAGEVRVLGQPIAAMSDTALTLLRRDSFGIIFQFFNLVPTLTVLENAVVPLYLAGTVTPAARKRAVSLLDEMGLGGRENDFPDVLSGGEQQRVAIVRATIHNPQIILADEPTGNLDSTTGDFVLRKLRELADSGKCVMMVTHSAEAAGFADRTLYVRDGRLVSSSEPS